MKKPFMKKEEFQKLLRSELMKNGCYIVHLVEVHENLLRDLVEINCEDPEVILSRLIAPAIVAAAEEAMEVDE